MTRYNSLTRVFLFVVIMCVAITPPLSGNSDNTENCQLDKILLIGECNGNCMRLCNEQLEEGEDLYDRHRKDETVDEAIYTLIKAANCCWEYTRYIGEEASNCTQANQSSWNLNWALRSIGSLIQSKPGSKCLNAFISWSDKLITGTRELPKNPCLSSKSLIKELQRLRSKAQQILEKRGAPKVPSGYYLYTVNDRPAAIRPKDASKRIELWIYNTYNEIEPVTCRGFMMMALRMQQSSDSNAIEWTSKPYNAIYVDHAGCLTDTLNEVYDLGIRITLEGDKLECRDESTGSVRWKLQEGDWVEPISGRLRVPAILQVADSSLSDYMGGSAELLGALRSTTAFSLAIIERFSVKYYKYKKLSYFYCKNETNDMILIAPENLPYTYSWKCYDTNGDLVQG